MKTSNLLVLAGLDRAAIVRLLTKLEIAEAEELADRVLGADAGEALTPPDPHAEFYRQQQDLDMLLFAVREFFELHGDFRSLPREKRQAFRRRDPTSGLDGSIQIVRDVKRALRKHAVELLAADDKAAAEILPFFVTLLAAQGGKSSGDIPRLTNAIFHMTRVAVAGRHVERGQEGGPKAHDPSGKAGMMPAFVQYLREEAPRVRQRLSDKPRSERLDALKKGWNARREVKERGWKYERETRSLEQLCRRHGIDLGSRKKSATGGG